MAFVIGAIGWASLVMTNVLLWPIAAASANEAQRGGMGAHSLQATDHSGCARRQQPTTELARDRPTRGAEEILAANRHRFEHTTYLEKANHDQLLSFLSGQSLRSNRAKAPRILIHFDYHSDLYRNDSHLHDKPNIGNYVNFLIHKRLIDEVWWILPDQSRSTQQLSSQWGCATLGSQHDLYWGRPHSLVDWQFRDGPPDQMICVAPSGAFRFVAGTDRCGAGDRVVAFKKRTLSDILSVKLPPFKGMVVLDIDADFFDHSGLYANEHPTNKAVNIGPNPRCYSYHLSPPQLDAELKRFALAITRGMDLYPDYIFVARSPTYATENAARLQTFFLRLSTLARQLPQPTSR